MVQALRLPLARQPNLIGNCSNETDLQRLRDLLEHETISRPVTVEVHGIATHPEDELVLATAVSAQADYLVTGDSQLQKLAAYQGVTIVSRREFLDVLVRLQAD